MKRSFGGGSGGMDGGGRGGGMLGTVRRGVHTGGVGGGATQEPSSHSTTPRSLSTNYKPTTSNTLCISSTNTNTSSSTLFNLPIDAPSTRTSSCSSPDEFDEWEFIDKIRNDHEDERDPLSLGFYHDDHFVFGSVPSQDKFNMHSLLSTSSFSQFMKERSADDSDKDVAEQTSSPTGYLGRVPSVVSEIDWMEPSMQLCNSRMLMSCRSDKVYDAFHLFRAEPSVQRMVISLSSNKAVWDAVLDNEVVRELRESLDEADNNVDVGSISDDGCDDSKAALDILSWIFINTKAKVMDLIDKLTKMMDELFLPSEIEKKTEKVVDSFAENLKTSFPLSVVLFLIVVLTRASKA